MDVTEREIVTLFNEIVEPELKWSINSLNLLKSLKIEGNSIEVTIRLITVVPALIELFRKELYQKFTDLGFAHILIHLSHINADQAGITGIKKIYFVGAGKGGVGKSTLSWLLAKIFASRGLKVGLLDADVYGPSLNQFTPSDKKIEVLANECMLPMQIENLSLMSSSFLVDEHFAFDWRGSVASSTVLQMLHKTLWGELDILFIDLPPGTGDILLSLSHQVKVDGAFVITTPDRLTLADARRFVGALEQALIPIVGWLENMAYLECQHCHVKENTSTNGLEALYQVCAEVPRIKLPFEWEFSQRVMTSEQLNQSLAFEALKNWVEANFSSSTLSSIPKAAQFFSTT